LPKPKSLDALLIDIYTPWGTGSLFSVLFLTNTSEKVKAVKMGRPKKPAHEALKKPRKISKNRS